MTTTQERLREVQTWSILTGQHDIYEMTCKAQRMGRELQSMDGAPTTDIIVKATDMSAYLKEIDEIVQQRRALR